jgi:hypothetical protein
MDLTPQGLPPGRLDPIRRYVERSLFERPVGAPNRRTDLSRERPGRRDTQPDVLPKAIPVAAEPRIRQTAIAATRLFTHKAYWDGCSDELLFTMVLTVSVGIQGALDGVEKC